MRGKSEREKKMRGKKGKRRAKMGKKLKPLTQRVYLLII